MSTFDERNYSTLIVYLDGTVYNEEDDDIDIDINYLKSAEEEMEMLKRQLLYAEHPEELEDLKTAISSTEEFLRIINAINNDEDLLEFNDNEYYTIEDEE